MLLKMANAVLVLFICGICVGNIVGGFESKLDLTHPLHRLLKDTYLSPLSFARRRNENISSVTNASTIPLVNRHENITLLRETENTSLEENGLIKNSKIVNAVTTDSEFVPTGIDETHKITKNNISSSTAELKTSASVFSEVKVSSVGTSNIKTNVSVPINNTTFSVLKTDQTVPTLNSTTSKANPSTIDVTVFSTAITPSTTLGPAKSTDGTSASYETSSKIATISDPTVSPTEEQKGSSSAESSTGMNDFSSTLSNTVTLSSSTPEEIKDISKSSKTDELTTATLVPKDNTASTTSEELNSTGAPKDTTVSISDQSTPEETTDDTNSSKSDELTTAEKTGSTPVSKDTTVSTTSEELKVSTDKPGSTSEVPKDTTVSESDKSTPSVGKSSTVGVKTSSRSTNPPSSVGVTDSTPEVTTGDITKHIPPIYNPTVTTVKLALSITFLAVAIVAMAALIAYMVKVRKRTIPYEELSLEP